MRVCVVGHGRSLKGMGLGRTIDSFGKVVRLKGSSSVYGTEDYGSKVDAMCASTEIMGTFFKQSCQEYWAYPKNGSFSGPTAISVIARLGKPVMIPIQLCNEWNQRFRDLGACHNNVSTGMAAIIIAIDRWFPKEIVLAGFDTLMNPDVQFDRNNEIPRSGIGDYPNHDWKKENELLKILEATYGVSISEICNHVL